MKFLEALSKTIVPAKLREDIAPEFGSYSGDPDSDSHLYRSLTSGARDLNELRLARSANIAYWLWLTNPYAKRGLDILSDFILGTGVVIEAKDPKTKKVLEDFWYGKPWCFEQKANDFLNVLHLFGELVLPFEVNTKNGSVSIAYIDPANIEAITINPKNALEMSNLKVKSIDKPFVIINDAEKAVEDGVIEGVFLFQINKIVNAVRGSGCLLSSINLLASLDDFLFAEIERTMMLRNFIWDITFEGASESEIKKWVSDEEKKPPHPGSIRGHNEKVTWNAVTPDFKTADSQNIFKILFNSVAVGLGVPEHWLGGPGFDINRATAQAMNDPIFKRLQWRQKYVKSMFELMFDFVLANAVKYGYETGSIKDADDNEVGGKVDAKTNLEYQLGFPEISPKNINELADVLTKITTALGVATMNGWIENNQASSIVQSFIEKNMGIELPEAEKALKENQPVY